MKLLHAAPAILMYSPLASLALAASTLVLLIASFNDIVARTLPDWACAALALIGLALRLQDGTALSGLAAAAAVFVLLLVLWFRGWMGGGDVKLLAACTLLAPAGHVVDLILATTIAGSGLAVLYLVLRRIAPRPGAATHNAGLAARVWRVECWRIARRGSLPYGCAISAGTLIILFKSIS